jgi:hypothetical protein
MSKLVDCPNVTDVNDNSPGPYRSELIVIRVEQPTIEACAVGCHHRNIESRAPQGEYTDAPWALDEDICPGDPRLPRPAFAGGADCLSSGAVREIRPNELFLVYDTGDWWTRRWVESTVTVGGAGNHGFLLNIAGGS